MLGTRPRSVMNSLHPDADEPSSQQGSSHIRVSCRPCSAALLLTVSFCLAFIDPPALLAKATPPDNRQAEVSGSNPGGSRSLENSVRHRKYAISLPEAGEVYLVWGINGWAPAPSDLRPAGTELRPSGPKNAQLMHTPMVREGDTFVAKVSVPVGTTIDYGFLITKIRNRFDTANPIWDGHENLSRLVKADGRIDVHASVNLTTWKRLIDDLRQVGDHDLPSLDFALMLTLAAGIGLLYVYFPGIADRRTTLIILAAVTFTGLVFRLWTAATTSRLHEIPPHIIGDEKGYNALAQALIEGSFFQTPETTPVYPSFLAASLLIFNHSYPAILYVQAFIGAAAIPLTYRLARHFTSRRASVLGAALIAFDPILISHVGILYTEALYTFLLLLTILCLWWALNAPAIGRYVSLGVLFAVTTLCRSGTALLPVILPFLMPGHWKIERRALLCLACGATILAIIAPWSYHNYVTYRTFLPLAVSRTVLWHGSPEFYHLMQNKPNAILAVWEEELNPARNGGHEPYTVEGDRSFFSRALQSIRREPDVYALYSLKKPLYFWIGHPAAAYEWPFDYVALRTYYSPLQTVMIVSVRLGVVMFAIISLVALRHRLHELAPLLAVCGYFMLLHTVTLPMARFSEPLHPIIAILIGTAVAQLSKTQEPAPDIANADMKPQQPCV